MRDLAFVFYVSKVCN